jgi:hypothetical protein
MNFDKIKDLGCCARFHFKSKMALRDFISFSSEWPVRDSSPWLWLRDFISLALVARLHLLRDATLCLEALPCGTRRHRLHTSLPPDAASSQQALDSSPADF